MIRLQRWLLALLLALVPAMALAQAPQDWSKVANRLPSGAFVLGNPDARVKLVEYLSLTCPHCAKFEGEAIGPLTQKYIRTGQVSYEVRHALRDAYDFAGSLLARCNGPAAFFAVLPKVYAQQQDWVGKAQAWAQTADVENLPPDELFQKVAAGAGFDALFGMDAARITACTANHDEQDLLTAMAGAAWRTPNFPGTPAFMINGALESDVLGWAQLDAKLGAILNPHPVQRKTRR